MKLAMLHKIFLKPESQTIPALFGKNHFVME